MITWKEKKEKKPQGGTQLTMMAGGGNISKKTGTCKKNWKLGKGHGPPTGKGWQTVPQGGRDEPIGT